MDLNEYALMAQVEDRMWWYHAAHANLLAAFERYQTG